jgi:hypothetical protein
MWPMVAMAVASTAYNAYNSSKAGSANAKNARAAAEANAKMARDTARLNVASTMAALGVNNKVIEMNTGVSNAVTDITAQQNAALARVKAAYSNELLDQEDAKLWAGLDLDIEQRRRVRDTDVGAFVAQAGASGTTIGEGSNMDVTNFIRQQAGFDELVMRHQADLTATDILNAKSRNSWEGEVTAQQYMWEGYVSQAANTMNMNTQVLSNTLQADINTANTLDQAELSASSGIYNGEVAANAAIAKGKQGVGDAIVNGASQIVSAYAMDSKFATTNTTATSTGNIGNSPVMVNLTPTSVKTAVSQ